MNPDKEKHITAQSVPVGPPPELLLEELQISDVDIAVRVITNSEIDDLPNRIELEQKGKTIQERYKAWIIKKILDHFKMPKEWLFFDTRSPWLMPDKTRIFFRINNTYSEENIVVIGDLNEAGNVTAWRIGLDK